MYLNGYINLFTTMKFVYSLLIALIIVPGFVCAQDEGVVAKKERIGRSSNIFITGGPSFTFGKNIGDYGTGFNIEAGFMKRVNRLLSIGPSISFIKFKYDPAKTTTADGGDDGAVYYGEGDIDTDWYGSDYDNWSTKYGLPDESWDYAYVLALQGGDISMISLSCNLKLNLVPVKDTSPVSVYIFAKPFITRSTRKAVTGTGTRYVYEAYEEFNYPDTEYDDWLYYNLGDNVWYADGYSEDWGPDAFEALKEESVITGGIFIGPGIEFMPAKMISIFLQPSIGYTFPVSFVSTKSYDNSIDSYINEEFPIVKKGFTSLNIQFGVSFNF